MQLVALYNTVGVAGRRGLPRDLQRLGGEGGTPDVLWRHPRDCEAEGRPLDSLTGGDSGECETPARLTVLEGLGRQEVRERTRAHLVVGLHYEGVARVGAQPHQSQLGSALLAVARYRGEVERGVRRAVTETLSEPRPRDSTILNPFPYVTSPLFSSVASMPKRPWPRSSLGQGRQALSHLGLAKMKAVLLCGCPEIPESYVSARETRKIFAITGRGRSCQFDLRPFNRPLVFPSNY
jgi:hypothetical protein